MTLAAGTLNTEDVLWTLPAGHAYASSAGSYMCPVTIVEAGGTVVAGAVGFLDTASSNTIKWLGANGYTYGGSTAVMHVSCMMQTSAAP